MSSNNPSVTLSYQTVTPSNVSHYKLGALVSRMYIPQPQYGRNCTLAVWNPLSNSFRWAAVGCHENITVYAVVCYVAAESQETKSLTNIFSNTDFYVSYIEDLQKARDVMHCVYFLMPGIFNHVAFEVFQCLHIHVNYLNRIYRGQLTHLRY